MTSTSPATSIRLYRTSPTLLNSKYCDARGQAIYRVRTPFALIHRTTTITRLLKEDPPESSSSSATDGQPAFVELDDEEDDEGEDDTKTVVGDDREPGNEKLEEAQLAQEENSPEIAGRYGHLATIEHKPMSATVFTWGGQSRSSKDLFTRDRSWTLGKDHVWTGSDGVEYRWKLHRTSELFLNNEPKTMIAKYRRKRLVIPRKAPEEAGPSVPGINVKKTACLEIFPAGGHIQDEIFITFLYVEKLRAVRQAAAASS